MVCAYPIVFNKISECLLLFSVCVIDIEGYPFTFIHYKIRFGFFKFIFKQPFVNTAEIPDFKRRIIYKIAMIIFQFGPRERRSMASARYSSLISQCSRSGMFLVDQIIRRYKLGYNIPYLGECKGFTSLVNKLEQDFEIPLNGRFNGIKSLIAGPSCVSAIYRTIWWKL